MGTHDGKEREAHCPGMQGLWMQFLTPWNNAPADSIQQPAISKTYNWGAEKSSVIFTEYHKSLGFYALFAEHNLPTNKAFFLPSLWENFPNAVKKQGFGKKTLLQFANAGSVSFL